MVRNRIASILAPARAAVAAGLTAALLAGCAPTLAPAGLETATPTLAQDALLTRDGLHLPLRRWDAEHSRVIIVALHGMSDYSEAFDLPGPWWAAHGITTYAYDQRGFGLSPNRGLWAGIRLMQQDLDDAVEAVRARYPGVPVYALGESMGGSVVLSSLASDRPPHVDGAILVAPAVWTREDMPLSYRVALWTAAHFLPWMNVSGEGLHIVACDNIEVLKKLSRDPIYQHSARADQVYGLVDLMDEARRAPEHLADPPPILFLYGAKDQVIPKEPTEATIAALGPKAQVHKDDNGYHMLLRDLDGESQWALIAGWIERLGKHPVEAAQHFALPPVILSRQEVTKQMGDKTKPDLRDKSKPATSLRDTNVQSPVQPSQPEDPGTDLHTVKPGVGAHAEGQTTRS